VLGESEKPVLSYDFMDFMSYFATVSQPRGRRKRTSAAEAFEEAGIDPEGREKTILPPPSPHPERQTKRIKIIKMRNVYFHDHFKQLMIVGR
jgi:hypothetical protein